MQEVLKTMNFNNLFRKMITIKIMKRYKLFMVAALTGFGVLLNSCSEDFLQKNPQGALAESVLASVDGIEALLIGAYAEVDGLASWDAGDMWRSTTTNWVYGDVYADDAYKGSDVGDQPTIVPIERYEHDSQNPYFNTKWLAMYDGISRCNDIVRILNEAVGNGSVDATLQNNVLAEVSFLRAFFHLELIKMFDYVVYVDGTAGTDLIANKPASTTGDGDAPWSALELDGDIPWEGFEADMQFAIDNLPVNPRNGEVGRATKSAAQSLMAKAKLFQGDYAAAATLLDAVIASGKYSLPANFHDNFRIAGDNNSESVFQVQASINDGSGSGYNGNYGDILNFPYTGGPGACCGFHQPTLNLVNAFKTTDGVVGGVIAGLPYLNAFGLNYNVTGGDVINDKGLGSGDPFVEDTRPLDPRLDWTVGRRGIPYLDWGNHPGRDWVRDQGYGGPYAPKKAAYYQAEEGTGSNAGGWGGGTSANNYSIVRYADVLLMRAECYVEANDLASARNLVNDVRGRMVDNPGNWVKEPDGVTNSANYVIARYPATGAPFDSQANAREAVRFERRLELALEGHRFWDLKRWGGAKTYLNNYIAVEGTKQTYLAGAKFDDRDIRFPIPNDAIERSEGTLSQNPGY
jgi:hypothetical protein